MTILIQEKAPPGTEQAAKRLTEAELEAIRRLLAEPDEPYME